MVAFGEVCNAAVNTPSPHPVGWFRSMFPLLPIAYLKIVSKEKE